MSDKSSGIPVRKRNDAPSSPKSGNGTTKQGQNILNSCQSSESSDGIGHNPKKICKDTTDRHKQTETKQSKPPEPNENSSKMNNDFNNTHSDCIATRSVAAFSCENNQSFLYYAVLILMTVLGYGTRLYRIEVPAWICWDETHFGKMGSWYINHSFFFDVHPPLGKMMIGFAGYLTGYDGSFPFDKPGDEYGEIQYVGMRVMCASLGAALVPLVYMSTWLLCKSVTASLFASSFVLFDVGTLTLTRYILLDPLLMFFIMAATYTLLKFLSYRERPFSLPWWFWLSCTGFFLACSMSVKFVGLFVVLLAGYSTVNDLWRLLGNQALSMFEILKHFVARALCLIVLPGIVYMIFFYIHFAVLYKSGSGDGFYSSQFQSNLEGNRLHNISMPDRVAFGSELTLKQERPGGHYLHSHRDLYPEEFLKQQQVKCSEGIAYGSIFSLKHQRTGGGYLHSHPHLYPEEHPPRQQQITTYSHKDENNMWRIKQAMTEPELTGKPVFVRNGDLVRLEHLMTKRNLHSHREPAPVTSRHFQVTGYGENGQGDANDVWQVQIPGVKDGAVVKVVKSKIKLIHYHVKCALQSHDKKLPKWGFEQLEVTCNPNVKDTKTLWSVEEVRDPRLPNVSFEVHAPSFLDKFLESHAVMRQGNSGLKPKDGEVTSRPWEWPINYRGQFFSGKDHRVYLLGNPIIFYGLLSLMILFPFIYLLHSIKVQRGVKISADVAEFTSRMFGACGWALIGWGLHYIPFWPMTRVLYFHHYFPALLYSSMFGGIILDYMIKLLSHSVPRSLSMLTFHTSLGLILSGTAYSFYLFKPLSYGMVGPLADHQNGMMHGLKWLDTWEI